LVCWLQCIYLSAMPKGKATKRGQKAMKEDDEEPEEEVEEVPGKRTRASASEHKKKEEGKNQFGLEITNHETIIAMTPRNNEELKRSKIAAFDMDSTLVEPKSGKKFPTNRNDWRWFFEGDIIPKKLKEMYETNEYRIVIISNQLGIGKGHQNEGDITGKIIDLSDELGIPLTAIFAKQEDEWRKPSKKMWQYFVEHCNKIEKKEKEKNSGLSEDGIDYANSIYVGDAAGRINGWNGDKKKKVTLVVGIVNLRKIVDYLFKHRKRFS